MTLTPMLGRVLVAYQSLVEALGEPRKVVEPGQIMPGQAMTSKWEVHWANGVFAYITPQGWIEAPAKPTQSEEQLRSDMMLAAILEWNRQAGDPLDALANEEGWQRAPNPDKQVVMTTKEWAKGTERNIFVERGLVTVTTGLDDSITCEVAREVKAYFDDPMRDTHA